MRAADTTRGATVVHSVHTRDATGNQFVPLMLRSVPDDVVTLPFSWRRAIFAHYDLFHLHWPEGLSQGPTTPRDVAKKLLTSALIARLYLTRTPVIRTIHNARPHEASSAVERLQARLLERRTATWIRLNPHTPVPRPGRVATIPHGHYRDWFTPGESSVSGDVRTLLFFGHVRPYKGCEGLLRAFADFDRPAVRLRLVGQPSDASLHARIEHLASQDDRVSTVLQAVDDRRLSHEIAGADLVVLPYEEMHNSGAMLLALSLDRPVLVPHNPVTASLAQEVGASWVRMFDPPLSAAQLSRALDVPRGSERPDLSRREWPAIGRQLAEAYTTTLTARAHDRPDRP